MLPLIIGLVGAGIQAATEAGKAIAAANAPKPISPEEIKGIYNEERQRATRGAYSQSMHGLQSLAGSGGSAGSQASSRRAAMMQAPAAMADATQAGYSAGGALAQARVGDMQGARGAQRNTALEIADQFGRVGHSAGILANDVKSGLVAQEALDYERQRDDRDADMRRELMDRLYPRQSGNADPNESDPNEYRPRASAVAARGLGGARVNPGTTSGYGGKLPDGYGTGGGMVDSDVHSKTRIKELETMNASLQSQLAAAGGGASAAGNPADQARRIPTPASAAASKEWGPIIDFMGKQGTPVDIDEVDVPEDGPVVPPPSNDPRYDTYAAPKGPKKTRAPLIREIDADKILEEKKRKKAADKQFVLDSIANTIR